MFRQSELLVLRGGQLLPFVGRSAHISWHTAPTLRKEKSGTFLVSRSRGYKRSVGQLISQPPLSTMDLKPGSMNQRAKW